MKKPEKNFKSALDTRLEKFKSQSDIQARLVVLRAMQFKKGERGIGTRDAEVKLLEQRLKSMQNPTCFPNDK